MRTTTLQKPGRTARDAVLDTLRRAYPRGVSTPDLIAEHGVAVKSRIADLRAAGWDITTNEEGGVAYYALGSLVQGPAARITAGCILRLDTRSGWTARTHSEAKGGPYSAEVLDEAEAAALAAYKAVLARHGHTSTKRVEPDPEGEDGYEPHGWTGDFIDDGEDEE